MRIATYNRKKKTVTWHTESGTAILRYFGVTDVTFDDSLDTTILTTSFPDVNDGEETTIRLPDTVLLTGMDY